MGSAAVPREFVECVAAELASAIDAAVECWLLQIQRALDNPHLTTLGRLNAVKEILASYSRITGKTQWRCQQAQDARP